MILTRNLLRSRNKSMIKIYHINTNQNKSGIFLLISNKVNFRAKKMLPGIKYIMYIGAYTYTKQKLTDLQREINPH